MKHLRKFNEDYDEDSSYDEVLAKVKEFVNETGLSDYASIIEEREAPSIILQLKKACPCFGADAMENQFQSDMMFGTDGLTQHFMADYTTLDDMYGQLRVLGSIGNSLEDCGGRMHRTYIAGDHILFELSTY